MSPDHAHVKRRRSRTAWPDPDEPPIAAATHEHSHRLPRSVKTALVGLMLAVFALCLAMGVLLIYIHDLTAYRDAEVTRIDQRIDRGLCDLLDQLPASPVLAGPRHKYGCGPGLPETPASSAPAAAPAAPTAAPPASSSHATGSRRATSTPRAGHPAAASTPTAPPTSPPPPPSPSTPAAPQRPPASPPAPDPICTLLTVVCLEVP